MASRSLVARIVVVNVPVGQPIPTQYVMLQSIRADIAPPRFDVAERRGQWHRYFRPLRLTHGCYVLRLPGGETDHPSPTALRLKFLHEPFGERPGVTAQD